MASARVDVAAITRLVERIGYLQRDPLAAVAPSHLLVLWSRLGCFDPCLIDQALWEERSLLEYWAHGASIIPTSDFVAHHRSLRRRGRSDGIVERRRRSWMAANRSLQDQILTGLRERGALPARAFIETASPGRDSTGWGHQHDAERMLFHLWLGGRVMVVGRNAPGRSWDLTERWLGPAVIRRHTPAARLTQELAERSLHALGVATELQIGHYMGAGTYAQLAAVLTPLVRKGAVLPVTIEGAAAPLPGRWLAHRDDLESLSVDPGHSGAATTFLSPFDNLIIDRARTRMLFGFDFRIETYVPPELRRFGYYVLPILHRGQLIGRADLRRDRHRNLLVAVALHGEPGAPGAAQVGESIRSALERLGRFVGMGGVEVGRLVSTPPAWERALRR